MNGTGKVEATMTCEKCETTVSTLRKAQEWPSPIPLPAVQKDPIPRPTSRLAGSYIPQERVVLALRLLIKATPFGPRSASRTGPQHNHEDILDVAAGEKCEALMGRLDHHPRSRRTGRRDLELIGKKEKMRTSEDDPAWASLLLRRNRTGHKARLNFALGKRDQATTDVFIEGLCHATSRRQNFQITTDGFRPSSAQSAHA